MDFSIILQLPIWQQTVLAIFGLSLLINLCYYFFFFIRVALHKPTDKAEKLEPVSVIICAWNEEENLKQNLQVILEQDYPEYEVIVVNDHSVDETDLLLRSWKEKYSHLKVIELTRDNVNMRGKKFAISLGIKGAKNENLVFTDADCLPSSNSWLKKMARNFSGSTEVILGYGGFRKKPGLLNYFYRYESVHIAMQYFSYAIAGMPYMGVGRNLAYKKDLFFKTKGFIKHRHVASGDDDLMVNEVSSGKNTVVEFSQGAHTLSEPCATWSGWWLQKRRHLSTGSYYKWNSKFFLGVFTLTHLLLYLSFFVLLSMKTVIWLALGGILVKWIVHLSIIRGVLRNLEGGELFLFSLLGDVFTPFFNTAVAISNSIKSPVRWR